MTSLAGRDRGLAGRLRTLAAPGHFYGAASAPHVRIALIATAERRAVAAARLAEASSR